MTRAAAALAVGALLLTPALSDAHLMPEGMGSTRLVGNRAYTLISVPVSVLSGFDDDGNGAISVIEARVHAERLHEQIERRVQLFSGDAPGITLYHDLQVPHDDSSSAVQSNAVIQIRVSQWDVAPTGLRLRADIFTRQQRELQFRAIIGDSTETATLTARRPQYNFFMGPNANDVAGLDLRATLVLAGIAAALVATAILLRRRQSVASSLSSAA